MRGVGLDFFLKTGAVLALFLVLASALGALLLITAVRWLTRRQIATAVSVIAVIFIVSAVRAGLEDRRIVQETGLGSALTFQRVLHHTNVAVNRASRVRGSPPPWSIGAVPSVRALDVSDLLLSHALFATLLLIRGATAGSTGRGISPSSIPRSPRSGANGAAPPTWSGSAAFIHGRQPSPVSSVVPSPPFRERISSPSSANGPMGAVLRRFRTARPLRQPDCAK